MYRKMKDEELEFIVGGLYTPLFKKKFYKADNLEDKESSKSIPEKNQIVTEKNVLA